MIDYLLGCMSISVQSFIGMILWMILVLLICLIIALISYPFSGSFREYHNKNKVKEARRDKYKGDPIIIKGGKDE